MAISFFIPVVLLFAESVGMQTSTVVVSALGSDNPPRLRALAARELLAAAMLGLVGGALMFGVSWAWLGDRRFSAVLGATLALTVVTASGLATLLPGAFRKAGVDPALAAAPLTLALTDNLTIFAYLLLASRLAI